MPKWFPKGSRSSKPPSTSIPLHCEAERDRCSTWSPDLRIVIRVNYMGKWKKFKIKKSTIMSKFFEAFAKRIGVDRGSLKWFLNLYAKCISENQTPNMLKMENDAQIICVPKQVTWAGNMTHRERLLYFQQCWGTGSKSNSRLLKKGLMKTKRQLLKE